MKPHREFWISDPREFFENFIFDDPKYTNNDQRYIHVIEHSAYLESLAQAEKLAAALSESKTMISKIKNHPFCLRCDSNIETKHRANAITSKALAEFQKWKGESK